MQTSSNLSIASTLTPSKSYELPLRRPSPSFPALLRWSLRDKKRVEAIVSTFSDRNDRLHEKIKLWCLASQLGVRTDHLRHLQNDQTSKSLGFDKDATLRLTQREAQNMQTSLELLDPDWDEYLKPIAPIEHQGTFTMFRKADVTMIQENHAYEGAPYKPDPTTQLDSAQLDLRTRDKVESLAKLLHQPKEQVFRVLPCTGWKYLPLQKSIAFVFEVQPRPDGGPVSLLRLIFDPDRRPELGDKFRLAMGLANSISQLHMVQWVSMGYHLNHNRALTCPRSTKVSVVKTFFSSLVHAQLTSQPSAPLNTPSPGFWASCPVDLSRSSPPAKVTLIPQKISIGTQNGKASHQQCSARFTTSTPWVSCC